MFAKGLKFCNQYYHLTWNRIEGACCGVASRRCRFDVGPIQRWHVVGSSGKSCYCWKHLGVVCWLNRYVFGVRSVLGGSWKVYHNKLRRKIFMGKTWKSDFLAVLST